MGDRPSLDDIDIEELLKPVISPEKKEQIKKKIKKKVERYTPGGNTNTKKQLKALEEEGY